MPGQGGVPSADPRSPRRFATVDPQGSLWQASPGAVCGTGAGVTHASGSRHYLRSCGGGSTESTARRIRGFTWQPDPVPEPDEELLRGGNMTPGVVRVGDTVRRPAGPWSPSVHGLLVHLEHVGFTGAPRSLGFDDQGRHVVEWIEGAVRSPFVPASAIGGVALTNVGRLVRQYHEAVKSFVPASGSVWNEVVPPFPSSSPPLVAHNDLAPWNLVLGLRSVFIDWDAASLGSVVWDPSRAGLAFAAVGPAERPDVVAQRLVAIASGYGMTEPERRELTASMLHRARSMVQRINDGARRGEPRWSRLAALGHHILWQERLDYLSHHEQRFAHALLAG